MSVPEGIRRFIESHQRFLVIGHREPDGDCIASQIVTADLLRSFGREASLYSVGPFDRPEIEEYADRFSSSIPAGAATSAGTALVVVDCSTPDRTGGLCDSLAHLPCLVIDHHSAGEDFGTLRCIDSSAASTSLLVLSVYEALGVAPTREQARLLLFGLCTDTGFFRHLSHGSAATFRAVAHLADLGTTTAEVFQMVYGRRRLASRRLLGRMLERAESHWGDALLLSWQTIEDRAAAGQYQRGEDDLYRLLQTVKGNQVVVFIRQEDTGMFSVSLRSTNDIDVGAVAARFGGGGHRQAAGFEAEGPLEAIRRSMLDTFAPLVAAHVSPGNAPAAPAGNAPAAPAGNAPPAPG